MPWPIRRNLGLPLSGGHRLLILPGWKREESPRDLIKGPGNPQQDSNPFSAYLSPSPFVPSPSSSPTASGTALALLLLALDLLLGGSGGGRPPRLKENLRPIQVGLGEAFASPPPPSSQAEDDGRLCPESSLPLDFGAGDGDGSGVTLSPPSPSSSSSSTSGMESFRVEAKAAAKAGGGEDKAGSKAS